MLGLTVVQNDMTFDHFQNCLLCILVALNNNINLLNDSKIKPLWNQGFCYWGFPSLKYDMQDIEMTVWVIARGMGKTRKHQRKMAENVIKNPEWIKSSYYPPPAYSYCSNECVLDYRRIRSMANLCKIHHMCVCSAVLTLKRSICIFYIHMHQCLYQPTSYCHAVHTRAFHKSCLLSKNTN